MPICITAGCRALRDPFSALTEKASGVPSDLKDDYFPG
jgi:hypothetical protein